MVFYNRVLSVVACQCHINDFWSCVKQELHPSVRAIELAVFKNCFHASSFSGKAFGCYTWVFIHQSRTQIFWQVGILVGVPVVPHGENDISVARPCVLYSHIAFKHSNSFNISGWVFVFRWKHDLFIGPIVALSRWGFGFN